MSKNKEIIEKEDIKELYINGMSPESISKIYTNYSAYMIRKYLRSEGILKTNHVITDEIFNKMVEDYNNGMNYKQLSEKYNYHAVNIGKKFKQLGLSKTKYYPNVEKEQLISAVNKMGFALIKDIKDIAINKQRIHICDNDGFRYITTWTLIRQGYHPLKYSPNNPYSIDNINLELQRLGRDEYYCPINQKYEKNNKELIFVHKPCGRSFISSWVAMQGKNIGHYKYWKQCRYCYPEKIESTHASVLKQVFLHEYPDTICEEKSCINPDTNRILPTDIVNHRLEMAIEIQSSYHDDEYKKTLDIIKRNFWINKKYNFYAVDIRDYSVLEMIQLFFPNIKDIPDYVDYHYSDKMNIKLIQNKLNEGLTIKEVADDLNIPRYTIHNYISRGTVILPDDSKRKAWNMKELVRLSKNGDFIKRYNYLNQVSEDGYALGTIQRVLNHKQSFAYDSYWVYGYDYDNDNYNIPTE